MLHRLCHLIALIATILSFSTGSAIAAILVQISGITNFSLPTWNIGDPAVSASIDVCVSATGLLANGYNITISSPGGYKLTSGANNLPYSLYWDDGGIGNLGNTPGTQLTNNVALTGRSNANLLSLLCITGPNARLNLKITQADMIAALAGTYTGTITLLIAPT